MNTRNKGNEYAAKLPGYDRTPKSVIAAILVSIALMQNEDDEAEARKMIRHEWELLYANGIVSQAPPKRRRRK